MDAKNKSVEKYSKIVILNSTYTFTIQSIDALLLILAVKIACSESDILLFMSIELLSTFLIFFIIKENKKFNKIFYYYFFITIPILSAFIILISFYYNFLFISKYLTIVICLSLICISNSIIKPYLQSIIRYSEEEIKSKISFINSSKNITTIIAKLFPVLFFNISVFFSLLFGFFSIFTFVLISKNETAKNFETQNLTNQMHKKKLKFSYFEFIYIFCMINIIMYKSAIANSSNDIISNNISLLLIIVPIGIIAGNYIHKYYYKISKNTLRFASVFNVLCYIIFKFHFTHFNFLNYFFSGIICGIIDFKIQLIISSSQNISIGLYISRRIFIISQLFCGIIFLFYAVFKNKVHDMFIFDYSMWLIYLIFLIYKLLKSRYCL